MPVSVPEGINDRFWHREGRGFEVIPAAARAAELAMTMWPSVRGEDGGVACGDGVDIGAGG